MSYHNFHCCPSCHEWVPKGLKVKHHANKLHCLVSVVLDQSQTMKTEQPRKCWAVWALAVVFMSMQQEWHKPPCPHFSPGTGFLPVYALLQCMCKSRMRNGSSGYENQVWPYSRCCSSGPTWVLLGYEKVSIYPQMVMFIVRHFQINEEAI